MSRRRQVFHVGKLPARRRPTCDNGCRGPFVRDALYTAWMRTVEASMGIQLSVDYGQCLHCGSHNIMPATLRGAA